MKKVLVITGSTASGKSSLGVQLAKQYNGEIISCDSVQVYKDLDIGSAKITSSEMEGIPHHLIDILSIDEPFSVAHFQQMAREKIDEITSRNKLPICVGGTGLYIKALLYDYSFEIEPEQADDFDTYSNQQLFDLLVEKDPKQAELIHINNRKRLLRVVRLMQRQQTTRSEIIEKQNQEMLYDAQIVYCTFNRETLIDRIHQRVDHMFEQGLLQEVTELNHEANGREIQAMSAIGYREFKPFFNQEISLDEVKEKIKTHTRQFSKRQMTWFKHQLNGMVVMMDDSQQVEAMYQAIETFVNQGE